MPGFLQRLLIFILMVWGSLALLLFLFISRFLSGRPFDEDSEECDE